MKWPPEVKKISQNKTNDLGQNTINTLTIENLFTHNSLVKLLIEMKTCRDCMPIDLDLTTRRRQAIQLSDFETVKVQEIINAACVFGDEQQLPVSKQGNDIYDGVGSFQFYIRKIVQYCGQISSFNLLGPADQFALLKPFCFDILLIRCTYLFDLDRKGYPVILVRFIFFILSWVKAQL